MHPQAVQIMETALALQSAPGERFRLRERPLPKGLVHVLEVASGASTAVAEAAIALGTTDAAVVDAARFYLEQVLFASPDANAYRILGVAENASVEEIRTHHRWLQRWLHPDRAQAGDATVFATRVNQAWAQLRVPANRDEYDRTLAGVRVAEATSAAVATATRRHWHYDGHDDMGAPSRGQRSRWLFGAALSACAVLAVLVLRHEEPDATWLAPELALAGTATEEEAPGERSSRLAQALARTPAVRQAAEAKVPRPVSVVRVAAPAPLPVVAAPAAQPTAPAPDRLVRTANPSSRQPSAADAPAPAARLPASATSPIPGRPALNAIGATRVALNAPSASPDLVVPAPSPTEEVAPAEARLLIERMHQAEVRVAQLAAYLVAQPDAAPLWNDVQTQSAADRVRDRIAGGRGARLELATPSWQLRPGTATYSADYRCRTCRLQKGRLDVDLVWRAGFWLVRGVYTAPTT
jgi:hypothetical protein